MKGSEPIASVRTVKSDDKQRKYAEEEWYSVIDELIALGRKILVIVEAFLVPSVIFIATLSYAMSAYLKKYL